MSPHSPSTASHLLNMAKAGGGGGGAKVYIIKTFLGQSLL